MANKKEPYDINSPEGQARLTNIVNQHNRQRLRSEYGSLVNKAYPLRGQRSVPGNEDSAIEIPGLAPMDTVEVRAKRKKPRGK